jgi:hypothetical protein
MTSESAGFPCPCCGHRVHAEPPGSSRVCRICFWEDDLSQLRWPDTAVGANKVSLIEAQRNYAEFAVSEARFQGKVRPPTGDEPLDEGWRRIDLDVDSFEDVDGELAPWPADRTVLYWWRPGFWRRA